MTGRSFDLGELVSEASDFVDPNGPQHLLSALLKIADPIRCGGNDDEFALRDAYEADFGVIEKYRSFDKPLETSDRKIWVDLLAWLLCSLRESKSARTDFGSLIAILRTASAFQRVGEIWDVIPEELYTFNLITQVSSIIGAMQLTAVARYGEKEPLWERAAVDSFLKADTEEDWLAISEGWQTVTSTIVPSDFLFDAVRFLNVCDLGQKALASALDKNRSILTAIHAAICMACMVPGQASAVAVHSTSNRTRFALVKSLTSDRPLDAPVDDLETKNLETVLRTIQLDEAEWDKWMQAFNQYPVQSVSLQPALGASLVNSSKAAKSSYVSAINLLTFHTEGREAVSLCLRVFQNFATLTDRIEMWSLSYQRWFDWDFGKEDITTSLTTSAVCDLDYAVVGYLTECLSATEFSDVLYAACDKISSCQTEWHGDEVAFNTAWYHALSRWQITIYADRVRKGKEPWECPMRSFLPFDPEKDRYAALSLGTRAPLNL